MGGGRADEWHAASLGALMITLNVLVLGLGGAYMAYDRWGVTTRDVVVNAKRTVRAGVETPRRASGDSTCVGGCPFDARHSQVRRLYPTWPDSLRQRSILVADVEIVR